MKAASSALLAVLGNAQFYMADCYTLVLQDGTVKRYTTADADIVDQASGNVFSSSGPLFERSAVKFKVGVQVDELVLTLTAAPNDLIDGEPWLQAMVNGLLDGATVQLDRAFMHNFGDTSAGLLTLFYGRATEIDVGRTKATITANTHLELLNLQWPWRLFQPGCSRTLFDAGCTLVKASFAVTAQINGTSTVQLIATNYGQPDQTASLGTLSFTSGALAGESFAIQTQVGGSIRMLTPLPIAPSIGDHLTVYPGCNKQKATCFGKFNNLQHFHGFPFVPAPETAA